MSTTILRLGLWTLIAVLALYVVATTYSHEPWAELIPMPMLQQALVVAVVLIVAGVVLHVLGKGAGRARKGRCQVCRTPVPPGAIYCRAHLRAILQEEDERTHTSRVYRR